MSEVDGKNLDEQRKAFPARETWEQRLAFGDTGAIQGTVILVIFPDHRKSPGRTRMYLVFL